MVIIEERSRIGERIKLVCKKRQKNCFEWFRVSTSYYYENHKQQEKKYFKEGEKHVQNTIKQTCILHPVA